MDDALSRLQGLIQALPSGLQDHLHRTRDTALEMAARHNVDSHKVELAALGHDLLRATTDHQLLAEARSVGLTVHPVEQQVPILLHGPLAAQRLRHLGIITDPEVLEAIHWHSTACPGMGRIGLVVFLADKLDPHKARRYRWLQQLAETAKESLETAAVEYLTREMALLLKAGSLLHPASVEARNHLLLLVSKPPGDGGRQHPEPDGGP
ncbi:MAG: bis(5'-nucleosyl)-tetraphosphatase (symmetrical) YqeK [Chloroflexota bacterium]